MGKPHLFLSFGGSYVYIELELKSDSSQLYMNIALSPTYLTREKKRETVATDSTYTPQSQPTSNVCRMFYFLVLTCTMLVSRDNIHAQPAKQASPCRLAEKAHGRIQQAYGRLTCLQSNHLTLYGYDSNAKNHCNINMSRFTLSITKSSLTSRPTLSQFQSLKTHGSTSFMQCRTVDRRISRGWSGCKNVV